MSRSPNRQDSAMGPSAKRSTGSEPAKSQTDYHPGEDELRSWLVSRQPDDDSEIAFDEGDDARPTHRDDDLLPADQAAPVDVTDRRPHHRLKGHRCG